MRLIYSLAAVAFSTFSLAALLAMTVSTTAPESRLTAELGPVTVIAVEEPPAFATGGDELEMKEGTC